jgi:hypothetical protein
VLAAAIGSIGFGASFAIVAAFPLIASAFVPVAAEAAAARGAAASGPGAPGGGPQHAGRLPAAGAGREPAAPA